MAYCTVEDHDFLAQHGAKSCCRCGGSVGRIIYKKGDVYYSIDHTKPIKTIDITALANRFKFLLGIELGKDITNG